MTLRSPTDNETALTLALSHQNGRGNFMIQGALRCEPSPACGRGKGEGLVPAQRRIFKGGHEEPKVFVGAKNFLPLPDDD
jgi:hypothetical protein